MLGLRKMACSAVESVAFASTVFLIVVTDSTLILEVFSAFSFNSCYFDRANPVSGFRNSHFTQTKHSTTWIFFSFPGIIRKYLHLLHQISES